MAKCCVVGLCLSLLFYSVIFSWDIKFSLRVQNFINSNPNHYIIPHIDYLRSQPFNGEPEKIRLLIKIVHTIALELMKTDRYALPPKFVIRINLWLNNIEDSNQYVDEEIRESDEFQNKNENDDDANDETQPENMEIDNNLTSSHPLLYNVDDDKFKFPDEIRRYCLLYPNDSAVKSLKFALEHSKRPGEIKSWTRQVVRKLKEKGLCQNCDEDKIVSEILSLNNIAEPPSTNIGAFISVPVLPSRPINRPRQLPNLFRMMMRGQMQGQEEQIEDHEYRSNIREKDLVGGFPDVLQDIKQMLKDNTRYVEVGAENPRTVLLYGLPGTGKTRAVKALAGELGYSFVYKSASEFVNKYVGEGAANVRRFFDLLIKLAKEREEGVIALLDELDAMGTKREDSHEERGQTLVQLMTYLDGIDLPDEIKNKISIFFATNRKDDLDEALIRSGRVNAIIELKLPDENRRKELLEYYFGKKTRKIQAGINLDSIFNTLAKQTDGCNYADMENIINKSALYAARHGSGIGAGDFDKALKDVVKYTSPMDPSVKMMYM